MPVLRPGPGSARPAVTVVFVGRDLLFGSRIADAVTRAGATFVRIDDPVGLPRRQAADLVLVDWAERQPGWGEALRTWARSEPHVEGTPWPILAFGAHRDLEAHAEARVAGIGPMLARSRVLEVLHERLASPQTR
jgi:hypothetical protein